MTVNDVNVPTDVIFGCAESVTVLAVPAVLEYSPTAAKLASSSLAGT